MFGYMPAWCRHGIPLEMGFPWASSVPCLKLSSLDADGCVWANSFEGQKGQNSWNTKERLAWSIFEPFHHCWSNLFANWKLAALRVQKVFTNRVETLVVSTRMAFRQLRESICWIEIAQFNLIQKLLHWHELFTKCRNLLQLLCIYTGWMLDFYFYLEWLVSSEQTRTMGRPSWEAQTHVKSTTHARDQTACVFNDRNNMYVSCLISQMTCKCQIKLKKERSLQKI